MLLLPLVLACSGGGDDDSQPTDRDDTDTPVDTDDPPDETGDTAVVPTGDTGPQGVVFDCATIPTTPVSFTQITGARGYHDLAFSPTGMALGMGTGFNPDLLQADYYGTVGVLAPGMGTVEQMAWLPGGTDLAVASASRGILRVAPNGASTVINGSIHPYGLILGPDDMLYSADQSQVHRVDPVTGNSEVLVPAGALAQGSPRVLAFNLDYTKLYMGTLSGSSGRIYVVDVDASLTPISAPTVFATGVGAGAYHDTLGVDICGYLYVADYSTSAMYRISPSGQVQLLFDASGFINSTYGHGMEWGSGVAGWNDHAIYITQPYNQNQVAEVVIGVPSRDWTGGTAINLP